MPLNPDPKEVHWIQPKFCRYHKPYPFTAETPDRLAVLREIPNLLGLPVLYSKDGGRHASLPILLRAHSEEYIKVLYRSEDKSRISGMLYTLQNRKYLQWYLGTSNNSFTAAQYAAGAVCDGVEEILNRNRKRVFCAVRPPGHHAGRERGEGFCLLNNVAIGALHALSVGSRVVIVDFDRHHGNGTEGIIAHANDERLLFISSYQEDCKYAKQPIPTGTKSKLIRVLLPLGSGHREVLTRYTRKVIPAILKHEPSIMLISAGFDLHQDDALRPKVRLDVSDFRDLTEILTGVADKCGAGIVSVLEGGYTIPSLRACVTAHVEALGQ